MDTYEGNYEDFTQSQQNAQDAQLFVKFYIKPRPDKGRTVSEGRPIYNDTEYVDIRVPGSRDGVSRPATPHDKTRFPRHYAAFQQRQEMPVDGTPLREWPMATRSMVEQLAYVNVKTVEQLAGMPDSNLGSFMGASNLKRQAQEWLLDAKDDAGTVKLTARLEQAEAQVVARDATIAELAERLTKMEQAMLPRATASVPDSTPILHSELDAEPAVEEPLPAPSAARSARRSRRPKASPE